MSRIWVSSVAFQHGPLHIATLSVPHRLSQRLIPRCNKCACKYSSRYYSTAAISYLLNARVACHHIFLLELICSRDDLSLDQCCYVLLKNLIFVRLCLDNQCGSLFNIKAASHTTPLCDPLPNLFSLWPLDKPPYPVSSFKPLPTSSHASCTLSVPCSICLYSTTYAHNCSGNHASQRLKSRLWRPCPT